MFGVTFFPAITTGLYPIGNVTHGGVFGTSTWRNVVPGIGGIPYSYSHVSGAEYGHASFHCHISMWAT